MALKRSIASLSLGRAWVHALPAKLDAAAAANYAGIELFYEDLEFAAKSLPGGPTPANLVAAHHIRALCDVRRLAIICLQPFMHFEGVLDRAAHAARLTELRLWFKLCAALGTDLIVIPSSFRGGDSVTGAWPALVADLREAADLGAQHVPPVRFAYEALCWGRFVDTWAASYALVCAVGRGNFGLCLDTFNICGREFADPAAADGCVPGAEAALAGSLERLRREVDVSRVFLVQCADAERMREPLGEQHVFHVEGQMPRMSWSRNARLFPGERARGAYLPTLDVMRAITGEGGLGYTGWVSFEVFSRTLADAGAGVPGEHARRGRKSWEWMAKELGWEGQEKEGETVGRMATGEMAGWVGGVVDGRADGIVSGVC